MNNMQQTENIQPNYRRPSELQAGGVQASGITRGPKTVVNPGHLKSPSIKRTLADSLFVKAMKSLDELDGRSDSQSYYPK